MSATATSTWVECSECFSLFERGSDEAWKRRCLTCWKRSKAAEKPTTADSYSAGYAEGRAEGLAERMAAYQRGFEAGRAQGLADAVRPAPSASAIDKARIRQLLQLVHPDKHGGSELATTITTWLLSLRKECE